MRPGVKGTDTSCPALFAACSTAAQPPSTITSASEIFFPPVCASLKLDLDLLEDLQHLGEFVRLVHLPVFLRGETMRGPLAPPRLSVPRKVDADAQAVETSWDVDSPDSRILLS